MFVDGHVRKRQWFTREERKHFNSLQEYKNIQYSQSSWLKCGLAHHCSMFLWPSCCCRKCCWHPWNATNVFGDFHRSLSKRWSLRELVGYTPRNTPHRHNGVWLLSKFLTICFNWASARMPTAVSRGEHAEATRGFPNCPYDWIVAWFPKWWHAVVP